jgi:membrane-bound serine protease (ClpP class)
MLVDSPLPFMRISLAVILPAVITTAAFFAFAVGAGLRAQRRKPVTGSEGLIGMRGNATTDIDGTGQAFIRGETWTVRSADRINKGEEVEVVSMDGLILLVKRPVSGTDS